MSTNTRRVVLNKQAGTLGYKAINPFDDTFKLSADTDREVENVADHNCVLVYDCEQESHRDGTHSNRQPSFWSRIVLRAFGFRPHIDTEIDSRREGTGRGVEIHQPSPSNSWYMEERGEETSASERQVLCLSLSLSRVRTFPLNFLQFESVEQFSRASAIDFYQSTCQLNSYVACLSAFADSPAELSKWTGFGFQTQARAKMLFVQKHRGIESREQHLKGRRTRCSTQPATFDSPPFSRHSSYATPSPPSSHNYIHSLLTQARAVRLSRLPRSQHEPILIHSFSPFPDQTLT